MEAPRTRANIRVDSPPPLQKKVKKTTFADGVRCASLGSRRTLCGNEAVSSLRSDAKMTDACLELQKKRKKKEGKKSPPKSGENRKGETDHPGFSL